MLKKIKRTILSLVLVVGVLAGGHAIPAPQEVQETLFRGVLAAPTDEPMIVAASFAEVRNDIYQETGTKGLFGEFPSGFSPTGEVAIVIGNRKTVSIWNDHVGYFAEGNANATSIDWQGPIALSALPGSGRLTEQRMWVVNNANIMNQRLVRGQGCYERSIPVKDNVIQWSNALWWRTC